MAARLPTPGGDDNAWGVILNDFLGQAHNSDGSLKQLSQSQVDGLVVTLDHKVNSDDLADVATSGSYVDLINRPSIPTEAHEVGAVASDQLDDDITVLVNDTDSATSGALHTAFVTKDVVTSLSQNMQATAAQSAASAHQPVGLPNSVTISNTTTVSPLISANFAAEDLAVGDVIQIYCTGTFLNTSGTAVTLAPNVSYGSSVQGGPGSFAASPLPYVWSTEVRLVVNAVDAQDMYCLFSVETPTGPERWVTQFSATQSLSVNSSLTFAIKLGTASTSAVFTMTSGWINRLPPSSQQVSPPLWFADYDLVGTNGTGTVQGVWYREQEPNSVNASINRISIVPAVQVPGAGAYKPLGNAMRVELHPYSTSNPGTSEPADGDVQGGSYNRAECYDRYPTGTASSTPPADWPDPVGSERWYGFSVFFPDDHIFATDSTWFTLTQWKGYHGGSPPLAIELNRQTLRFGGTRGPSLPGYNLMTVTAGKWYKIVVGIKWSTQPAVGWVNVIVNDQELIPRFYTDTMDTYGGTGDLNADPIYLKQGIYRSKDWSVTHVLHFGNMVVGRHRGDVESKLNSVLGA